MALLADFLVLLQPFAPHLAEELWSILIAQSTITHRRVDLALAYQPWPVHDPALLVEETLELPVQVNGKLRDRIVVPTDAGPEQVEAAALAAERVKLFLEGKTIKKVILVPRKLVNIVAG